MKQDGEVFSFDKTFFHKAFFNKGSILKYDQIIKYRYADKRKTNDLFLSINKNYST